MKVKHCKYCLIKKKYRPIYGFKEVEQRNRRETELKHKKTRRETEIIKGKHFNLESVSESFQCVSVFVVKQNNTETDFKLKCFPLFISISLLFFCASVLFPSCFPIPLL